MTDHDPTYSKSVLVCKECSNVAFVFASRSFREGNYTRCQRCGADVELTPKDREFRCGTEGHDWHAKEYGVEWVSNRVINLFYRTEIKDGNCKVRECSEETFKNGFCIHHTTEP